MAALLRRGYFFRKALYVLLGINIVLYILYFMQIPSSVSQTRRVIGDYAYITFTNNDNYAKGAVALAMSLMEVGSYYPLVVMVTKEVSTSTVTLLENIGCIVYETDLIELPPELSLQTARWGPAFTKLVSWEKTEYKKLMFMDSDLLVLQNVDHLFESNHNLLATVDADASSCSHKPERLELINSGVLVLTPSKHTYERLIQTLHNKTFLAAGNVNDQDVIVNTMPWHKLNYPTYGAQVTHCECSDERLWDFASIKIIHFTAGLKKLPKPWDYKKTSKNEDIPTCVLKLYDIWKERYDKALDINKTKLVCPLNCKRN